MTRRAAGFSKVLILGIDGLDPRCVTRMVHEGQLPAFGKLQQSGTLRALETSNPAQSPVAWSSLATGCNPGKHGVFDFIHRDPSTYVPFLSVQHAGSNRAGGKTRYCSTRRMPGFWRMTSDAGVPTTVVRWPVTFPAESVNGRFLAGLGVPDVTGRLGKHTVYTTAGEGLDDDDVVRVAWRGNEIATHLFGPTRAGLGKARPMHAELIIRRTDRGIALRVGSQRCEIELGQWSPWFPVSFKWGPVHICDAIVKFHLVGVEPDLRLFATPLQVDPRSQMWPLTQPASYGADLADQLGLFYTLGLPEDTNAVTDGIYDLDAFLHQCAEINGERRAMFEHELNCFREGTLAFVFDTSDRLQHMFWSVEDETSPTYDLAKARKYGHVIRDLYREMDDVVAGALDAAGEDTAVFVVSDHGFAPFHRAVHTNRWLIDSGFMKLKGSGEGRSLFADVDWGQTQAYAVGFAGIYLNLAGRESRGAVKPGEEAAGVLEEVSAGLCQQRDRDRDVGIIRNTYYPSDAYAGPCAGGGPDLIIGFEPGYRSSWQTALGGAPASIVVDNTKPWAADHLVDPAAVPGLLAATIPVTAARPQGVDLAPTVLDCFELPLPSNMDGQSWLSDVSFRRKPFGGLCSAELEPVGAAVDWSNTHDGLDEQQRAQLERHLSDLGYL